MALDGIIFPSGLKKSSRVSSFQVPKSPLVFPLKDVGAAQTIVREPCSSVTVTDIPEGNVTRKELPCGRDSARDPLTNTLEFVKLS